MTHSHAIHSTSTARTLGISKNILSLNMLKPLLFTALFLWFFPPALQAAEYLGGNVWLDSNVNGIQDAGEVGVAGITVTITGVSVTYSGSTTTASDGSWSSADLRQGKTYSATFSGLPAGYLFSPQDQGTNDNLDSDPNPSTGVTIAYTVNRNQTITHVDAGIYLPQEIDIQGNGNSILKGDISPSTIDGTDFGSTYITGGTVSRTFTIANTGDVNLLLSGSPMVAISGTHASNFTVTTQPTSPVSGRSSNTFVIRFAPSAVGLRSATVTIANNDSNENPYTFAIQGTGTPPPEMDVSGNGISIFSGDSSPSVTDHTYFGSADIVTGSVDYTFTISNTGGFNLSLSGSPVVQLSGTHAADFLVIAQASASIVPAGTSTFVLRFDPSAAGLRTATVSIANNDLDENPYTFSVQGTGSVAPEMDITGKGLSIVDGSTTASLANDSDFGNTDVNYGSTIHTFSINNSGSGALTLTGSPLLVTVFGTHASDFTVSQQPASSTVAAQGGSVSFQVTFNPPTTGLRQATISITNNDANESPYTFAVQGTGTINPEISVLGNGTSIANGASTLTSTDSTDFDSTLIGGTPHVVTYTIQNTGPAQLTLTGSWPLVTISGAHAGDFSVISAPSSPVASGGSTTFKVEFNPITAGIRSATLTILNNDLDEGNFSYAIQGTGISGSATLCEINVQGNLTNIDSLNNTPNTTDGTDFGSVSFVSGTLVQTFMISNTGSEDLILTRSPLVTISGDHASDFSITLQPSSPIAPAGSVPFNVSFNPSAPGLRTAIISIESNDDNENPYDFSVQGFGLSYPEIEVRGNNNIIYSGDATPNLSDSTDFGDVHPVLVTAYATYTIFNTGDSALVLTDNPLVRIEGDAAGEYAVTSFPNASIPPGGSSDFTVKFDPAQTGTRNVMVSIDNNDGNESPYTFWLTGYGRTDLAPFPCISRFYHIYGDEGIVSYMDATVNPYAYTEITRANYSINGAGYNLEDGLLYAFEQDNDVSGDKIIRIDGDLNLDVLSVNVPFLSWRADFDVSGNMYFWNEAGTSIGIFDASEGTITTQTTSGATWVPIDMAYLDFDGNFYGMHEATLYQYNPNTNAVSTIPITGRLADDYVTNVNSAYYGAAWSADDGDGYLFTTNSQSGRMYKISSAGFSIYVGLGATNLNKSDGASCPLAPAPLPTTGQVGNRVWVDSDADGVQDTGEPGLPGVTVDLYSIDSPFIASTVTDENGEYLFQNLSPSEYYIIFSSAPAGFSLTLQDQGGDDVNDSDADPSTGQTADFFVGVGLIEEGIDAGYKANGVGDFIWDDLNNNGDQDYGEPGIPGVTVELVLESSGSTANATLSNAFGRYSFTNVTPASYRIRVSNIPGGYSFVSRNSGATDAVDSDVDASGLSDLFTISTDNFNSTIDAGLTQQSVPDISVFGSSNFNAIPDGQTIPLTSNGTDLGNQVISLERLIPIRITNAAGGADLTLNGTPILAFSGPHAADFSYSGTVPTTIAAGSSVDFYLSFTPSADGLRSAVVSISNNDPDENPYDFSIQGTGIGPEIVVRGNGLEIISGDITPSVADATDFGTYDIDTGSGNAVFTIQNTGGYDLTLDGTSLVAIGGAHAADFSITSSPTSTVAASGSTTFTVHFDPSAAGLRTANISIENSDPDEDPYTFNIQGTGTATQEIALQGNLINIVNGDTSPALSDLTDFGSRDIFAAQIAHSFTIQNVGSGVLTLTGLPRIQISGANAGDFVVSQQPSSSTVSPSGSLTFQVAFDPTTTGVRQATVIIANNDSDENPFTFA